MTCATCGMRDGACVHEESNVDAAGHTGYQRGAFDDLAAVYSAPFDPTHRNEVLSHFPTRPQLPAPKLPEASSQVAAAGGAVSLSPAGLSFLLATLDDEWLVQARELVRVYAADAIEPDTRAEVARLLDAELAERARIRRAIRSVEGRS